ncbi:hypothetical protein [Actinokineospora diospyrosa]|uniref:hypothetical protein n=1 Tax=Actinokineospora diospyrosa TaxID=103728 RepID=UPI0020A4395F|nr:hypothetical protein [Actinokineospora diospyrosa]
MSLGAAPLFGAERTDWWPGVELRAARPGVSWVVVNDVSALLCNDELDQTGAAAAVSMGIAYRTIDLCTRCVPYDREHGCKGRSPVAHVVAGRTHDRRARPRRA